MDGVGLLADRSSRTNLPLSPLVAGSLAVILLLPMKCIGEELCELLGTCDVAEEAAPAPHGGIGIPGETGKSASTGFLPEEDLPNQPKTREAQTDKVNQVKRETRKDPKDQTKPQLPYEDLLRMPGKEILIDQAKIAQFCSTQRRGDPTCLAEQHERARAQKKRIEEDTKPPEPELSNTLPPGEELVQMDDAQIIRFCSDRGRDCEKKIQKARREVSREVPIPSSVGTMTDSQVGEYCGHADDLGACMIKLRNARRKLTDPQESKPGSATGNKTSSPKKHPASAGSGSGTRCLAGWESNVECHEEVDYWKNIVCTNQNNFPVRVETCLDRKCTFSDLPGSSKRHRVRQYFEKSDLRFNRVECVDSR